jgi:hypothetical protein
MRLTESQKVIFLGSVGVVMVAATLALAALLFFGDNSSEEDGEEANVIVPVQSNNPVDVIEDVVEQPIAKPDWRQSVVDYETVPEEVESAVYEEVQNQTEAGVPDYSEVERLEAEAQLVEILQQEDFEDVPVSTFAGTVSIADARPCGDIDVPTGGIALMMFGNQLPTNPVVECFGAAVGSGCDAVSIGVYSGGEYQATGYILERPDGVCSIGSVESVGEIVLCDITSTMNQVTGDTKTAESWEASFSAMPGDTMASLLQAAPTLLQSGLNNSEYGCQKYRY